MSVQLRPKGSTPKVVFCPYGSDGCQCQYAHSNQEYQRLPEIYRKIEKCVFYSINECPLTAEECNFAHGPSDKKKIDRVKNAKERSKEKYLGAINGNLQKQIVYHHNGRDNIPKKHITTFIDFLSSNDGLPLSCFPTDFLKQSGLAWTYTDWGFLNLTDSIKCLDHLCQLRDDQGQPKIYILQETFKQREAEKERIPVEEPQLELQNSTDNFNPLPSDRSHYSDWGNQEATERPIKASQLMLQNFGMVTCNCGLVISRESMLFPCGHLYCRCCCGHLVDRKERKVYCPQCPKECWSYKNSCYEVLHHIHIKSIKPFIRRLAETIENSPCRCIQHSCPWRGTIARWRNHHPVCPSIRKAAQNPVLDEDLKGPLEPDEVDNLTLDQHQKYIDSHLNEHQKYIDSHLNEHQKYTDSILKAIEGVLCRDRPKVRCRQSHRYKDNYPRYPYNDDYSHDSKEKRRYLVGPWSKSSCYKSSNQSRRKMIRRSPSLSQSEEIYSDMISSRIRKPIKKSSRYAQSYRNRRESPGNDSSRSSHCHLRGRSRVSEQKRRKCIPSPYKSHRRQQSLSSSEQDSYQSLSCEEYDHSNRHIRNRRESPASDSSWSSHCYLSGRSRVSEQKRRKRIPSPHKFHRRQQSLSSSELDSYQSLSCQEHDHSNRHIRNRRESPASDSSRFSRCHRSGGSRVSEQKRRKRIPSPHKFHRRQQSLSSSEQDSYQSLSCKEHDHSNRHIKKKHEGKRRQRSSSSSLLQKKDVLCHVRSSSRRQTSKIESSFSDTISKSCSTYNSSEHLSTSSSVGIIRRPVRGRKDNRKVHCKPREERKKRTKPI